MSILVGEPFFIQGPDGALSAQRWGERDKPVLVLVHGYPDNRLKWEAVAQWLARRFQVIAYDVRGAGASFKPQRRQDYRLARLTADFTAVIDAVSPTQPVHLVAHDWGSVQSWEFVSEPALMGRIASFTSCSGPCLDHVGHWMRDQLRYPSLAGWGQLAMQLLKSWYVYFFHLPWLPEAMWRGPMGRHWPRMMHLLEGTTIQPRPTQGDDGAYGVNLYRANVLPCLLSPRERIAHAPVQVLVPMHDRFVSPALTAHLQRWVPRLTRREIDAGHWVTLQQPELFARAVQEFIVRLEASAPPAQHLQRTAFL
jgi:pimeloyl-ACP methyl ester carboxylesterase